MPVSRIPQRERECDRASDWRRYSRSAHRLSSCRTLAKKLAIPGNGFVEALVEAELRTPVEHAPGALGAQILMPDLIQRLGLHLGSEVRAHPGQDLFHQLQSRDLYFIGEINREPGQFRLLGESLRQEH